MGQQVLLLIAEDDPKWARALKDLYASKLEGFELECKTVDSLKEGRAALSERPWDLLSIDVILRDRSGLDLLKPAQREGVKGVIVVSGLQTDPDLPKVMPHREERNEARAALQDRLDEHFPNRYRLFFKLADDIGSTIEVLEKSLRAETLRSWLPLPPPYKVVHYSSYLELSSTVTGDQRRLDPKTVGPDDFDFLSCLVEWAREGKMVDHAEVFKIYSPDKGEAESRIKSHDKEDRAYIIKTANMRIDMLRRKLKAPPLCLDPSGLFSNRKRHGWMLKAEERGRGGRRYMPGDMDKL